MCIFYIYINNLTIKHNFTVHVCICTHVHEILWLCRVPTFECHHHPSCLVGLFKPKHILFCLYSDKQKTMKCKYDIIAILKRFDVVTKQILLT